MEYILQLSYKINININNYKCLINLNKINYQIKTTIILHHLLIYSYIQQNQVKYSHYIPISKIQHLYVILHQNKYIIIKIIKVIILIIIIMLVVLLVGINVLLR
jgi:hypothetical protein